MPVGWKTLVSKNKRGRERMIYFNNNDNVLLSQAEIDKLIKQMEKEKEEKE